MFKQALFTVSISILTIFFCLTSAPSSADYLSKKTIVVMPFVKGKRTDIDIPFVDTSIRDFPYVESNLTVNADTVMTLLVHRELDKRFADVIPLDQAASTYQSVLKDEKNPTVMTLALQLGKALDADYVVTGNVWRYKERSGNALASSSGASVAFKINLIKVSTKTHIWQEASDKTQEALSSNLLKAGDFVKQGPKWLSVKELALKEIEKSLKTFPIKEGA